MGTTETTSLRDTAELVIFASLAVLGLLWPWSYNLAFMAQYGGFSVSTFVADAFANPAASSLSADIAVAGTAWLVWMFPEARRLGMNPWLYLGLTMLVALAFACPLFYLQRKRLLMSDERGLM